MKKKAIGIDLGTTNSVVGVWRNGKVDIIPNNLSQFITPSIVSFDGQKRLIGDEAKNAMIRNFQNTVFDSKRFIGRNFDDKEVQKDIQKMPFKIEKKNVKDLPFQIEKNEKTNKCSILVQYNNKDEKFNSEEISAMILEKMKKISEDFLGEKVTDAVITVPAYFNENQRQATRNAGIIAGLNVLRIINEPTAAAIAYGLQNKSSENRNVLIFDLGGGTFDVTVLLLGKNNKEDEDTIIEVKAISGNTHLGGEDFDECLKEYCIEEFMNENDIDIKGNTKAKRRLKVACEKAKIQLSNVEETTMEIESLAEGEDLNLDISRHTFEDVCKEKFEECITSIKDALNKANLKKEEIDDIVLVGGSSRIPKIRQMVKEFFNRDKLIKSITINPDEAVAYGAAYQAAILNGDIENDNLILLDIVGISLGLEGAGGFMEVVVPNTCKIPTQKVKKFVIEGNSLSLKIYQGENEYCKDNHFLKEFKIDNVNNGDEIEVLFTVDVNCILSVSATNVKNGKKQNVVINDIYGRLKKEELKHIIERAGNIRENDRKNEEIGVLKNQLKKLCFTKKDNQISKNVLKWIDEGIGKNNYFTIEELKKKLNEVQNC